MKTTEKEEQRMKEMGGAQAPGGQRRVSGALKALECWVGGARTFQAKPKSGTLQCRPRRLGAPSDLAPKKPSLRHPVPGAEEGSRPARALGRNETQWPPALSGAQRAKGSRTGNRELRPPERSEQPACGSRSAHVENC